MDKEVSMVILDVVEMFIELYEIHLKQIKDTTIMDKILKLLLEFLKRNQCESFLTNYYATLKAFISKFPSYFFDHLVKDNKKYKSNCHPLVFQVLKQCEYKNQEIRSQASAFIYLMFRKNFEHCKNFTRMRVSLIVALTSYLGTLGIEDDSYLKKSMGMIAKYAILEYPPNNEEGKHFRQKIELLIQKIFAILSDSTSIGKLMNEEGANEMITDLYERISENYRNFPELRISWLETLAEFQEKKENYPESAQCWVQIGSLLSEYMHIKYPNKKRPQGALSFLHLSKNATKESSFFNPSLEEEEEGVYDSGQFNENVLVDVMTRIISKLKKAELYESANELYKLLIPIFEKNRDYVSLEKSHFDLKHIFNKIISSVSFFLLYSISTFYSILILFQPFIIFILFQSFIIFNFISTFYSFYSISIFYSISTFYSILILFQPFYLFQAITPFINPI